MSLVTIIIVRWQNKCWHFLHMQQLRNPSYKQDSEYLARCDWRRVLQSVSDTKIGTLGRPQPHRTHLAVMTSHNTEPRGRWRGSSFGSWSSYTGALPTGPDRSAGSNWRRRATHAASLIIKPAAFRSVRQRRVAKVGSVDYLECYFFITTDVVAPRECLLPWGDTFLMSWWSMHRLGTSNMHHSGLMMAKGLTGSKVKCCVITVTYYACAS